jgi:hypothetical protein
MVDNIDIGHGSGQTFANCYVASHELHWQASQPAWAARVADEAAYRVAAR